MARSKGRGPGAIRQRKAAAEKAAAAASGGGEATAELQTPAVTAPKQVVNNGNATATPTATTSTNKPAQASIWSILHSSSAEPLPDISHFTQPIPVTEQMFLTGEVDHVVEICEGWMVQQQYQLIIPTLESALQCNASYTPALDLLAQALIEAAGVQSVDDEQEMDAAATASLDEQQALQRATELLQKSVIVDPQGNAMKYFYLAQLLQDAKSSVQMYQQGIALLQQQIKASKTQSSESEQADLHAAVQQCASAYCSIAEIYMTDLCDEPEAESTCNQSLLSAISLAPTSIEALFALANLRFIQERTEESAEYVKKAYNAVQQKQQQQSQENEDADAEQDSNDDISYELRLNISKLLLEHNHNTEALQLLEDLYGEDDRFVEVIHLLAVTYSQLHDYEEALIYVEEEEKLLKKMPPSETREIRSALKQLKQYCLQQLADGKQVTFEPPASDQNAANGDAEQLSDDDIDEEEETKVGDTSKDEEMKT